MKKRVLSLLLAFVLLLSALPVQAAAAEKKAYGEVPIYLGFADVDYMAEEILKEIDLEGKTGREKILAVYNWIIVNCKREGDYSKMYFDVEDVLKKADGTFGRSLKRQLKNGEITVRIDVAGDMIEYPENGMFYLPYDSNYYIGQSAADMMVYRIGHCANFSALLTVLLGHLGFDCRLIDGEFVNRDGSRYEHKWNMVLLDGKYLWMDVRMDHANYVRTGRLDHQYFLVESQAEWEKRHVWDHGYSDGLIDCADLLLEKYGFVSSIPGQLQKPEKPEEPEQLGPSGRPWQKCSAWAEPYLIDAVEKGLYPDCLLYADTSLAISRAEFASVAVRFYEALSGQTLPDFDPTLPVPFTDVTAADADILKAYQLGVVKGIGDGTFRPKDALSREQAVTMLGRVCELVELGMIGSGAGLQPGSQTVPPFSDAGKIGAWSAPYVNYFVSHGVVNGTDKGTFAPTQNMTREAALKVAAAALAD